MQHLQIVAESMAALVTRCSRDCRYLWTSKSFADWIGVSHARGGLAVGTGLVSVVLAGAIGILVGYLAVTKCDVRSADGPG